MQVKALVSFHAYNILASTGEILNIEDKGIRADLEKLGWIEPVTEKKTFKAKED